MSLKSQFYFIDEEGKLNAILSVLALVSSFIKLWSRLEKYRNWLSDWLEVLNVDSIAPHTFLSILPIY